MKMEIWSLGYINTNVFLININDNVYKCVLKCVSKCVSKWQTYRQMYWQMYWQMYRQTGMKRRPISINVSSFGSAIDQWRRKRMFFRSIWTNDAIAMASGFWRWDSHVAILASRRRDLPNIEMGFRRCHAGIYGDVILRYSGNVVPCLSINRLLQ